MNRVITFIITFFIALYAFGQNVTDDRIEQYARDLGVPVSELRLLIERYNYSYNINFTDPRADHAQPIGIFEAQFLIDTGNVREGVIYKIQSNCRYVSQIGNTVSLYSIHGEIHLIRVISDTMLRLERDMPVNVLLEYRRDNRGIWFYHIVEIVVLGFG